LLCSPRRASLRQDTDEEGTEDRRSEHCSSIRAVLPRSGPKIARAGHVEGQTVAIEFRTAEGRVEKPDIRELLRSTMPARAHIDHEQAERDQHATVALSVSVSDSSTPMNAPTTPIVKPLPAPSG